MTKPEGRANRIKTIGVVIAGATATIALTGAGLWLLNAAPSTPTAHPATPAASTPPPAQNLPAPATTSTASRPPAPKATPTVTATGPGDPMAGAIPDSLIQQTLDEAGLTTVDAATAKATRAVAWTALAADLQAGGWSHPHLQASAVTVPGNDHTAPTIVDVIAIWAATGPAGQPVDRQRSTVRLIATAGRWSVDRIT